MVEDTIFTFHGNLEAPDGVFSVAIEEGAAEAISTVELLADEDERRLVVSLLNMAISRHVARCGLSHR